MTSKGEEKNKRNEKVGRKDPLIAKERRGGKGLGQRKTKSGVLLFFHKCY
jgi:hypothetical protein